MDSFTSFARPGRKGWTIARLLGSCGRCLGLLVGAAATLVAAETQAAGPLDAHRVAVERFGADAPWYENNVPLFESSDPLLDKVYYYRWQIVRAHQRDLGAKGYITTEFLDDVGWQREPYPRLTRTPRERQRVTRSSTRPRALVL